MRRRTVLALVLTFGVAAAGAAVAAPAAATMVVRSEAVTADAAYQSDVATDGSYVVWAQKAVGGAWDIWGAAIDADHGVDTPAAICAAPGDQRHPQVANVAGAEFVVWQDKRSGHWDILGERLSDATEFPVCTVPRDQASPRIDGTTVVWQDHRGATWDVYGGVFDPATLVVTETPLWTGPGDQTSPDVAGGRVVYATNALGNGDIYETDLGDPGAQTPVADTKAAQDQPALDGSVAVWRDARSARTNGTDIYAHDFAADVTRPVITAVADQSEAALSGDVLLCTDSRNEFLLRSTTRGTDITLDDLTLGQEGPLCVAKGDQAQPAAAGDDAFWIDFRTVADHGDVRHAVLSPWSAAVWATSAGADGAVSWTNTPHVDLWLYAVSKYHGVVEATYWMAGIGVPGSSGFSGAVDGVLKVAGYDLSAGSAAGDGPRTIEASFQDDGGLEQSPTVKTTVTLDTTPPRARARVSHGVHGGTATIRYRVDDNLAPRCPTTIVVKTRAGKTVTKLSVGSVAVGSWRTRSFACALRHGAYVFTVQTIDLAGNAAPPASAALYVR